MAGENLNQASLPKRSKRLSAYVLDGLLCGVLTTLIGTFASFAIAGTPLQKNVISDLASAQTEMTSYIVSSSLNSKKENGELFTLNELSDSFLLSFTKASLLHHNVQELPSIYKDVAPASLTSDRLCYYYNSFKVENASYYMDLGNVGKSFYFSSLKENQESDFEEDGYIYFTMEAVEAVDEALRNPDYHKGNEIIERTKKKVIDMFQIADNELSSSYLPYVQADQSYNAAYQKLVRINVITSLISALLATLLYFLVVPHVQKEGKTIGMKAMKLEYRGEDDSEIHAKQELIRASFAAIGIPIYAGFAVFLLPHAGFSALIYPLFGQIALWTLLVISFSLILINYAFSFFGQKRTLTELASRTHLGQSLDKRHE